MFLDVSNYNHYCALVDELKIMSNIRAQVNVLSLLGACTDDLEKKHQLFILTEFREHGSLRDYLIKNRGKFEDPEVSALK